MYSAGYNGRKSAYSLQNLAAPTVKKIASPYVIEGLACVRWGNKTNRERETAAALKHSSLLLDAA